MPESALSRHAKPGVLHPFLGEVLFLLKFCKNTPDDFMDGNRPVAHRHRFPELTHLHGENNVGVMVAAFDDRGFFGVREPEPDIFFADVL